MSNSSNALSKPYITNCALCNSYIPEEAQTSTKKYCSTFCYQKSKRDTKKLRSRNNNRPTTFVDPEVTRRKMQEEINELCVGKKRS